VAPQFSKYFEDDETYVIREQGCIQSVVKPPFHKSVFVATKNLFKSFPIARYEEVVGEAR